DPFSLIGSSVEAILQRSAEPERRAILEQVLTVYPTGVMVNQILGFLARREGAFDKALAHAEVLLEYAPEAPVGYRLKADVLSDRQLWRESIYWYREALKRASGQGREDVARELGLAYEKLGQTR